MFPEFTISSLILCQNQFKIEACVLEEASNGVFLLGDGKGNFKFIDHKKSGFFMPFDSKRLKKFNYQGEDVIVVGNNNDYYQFMKVNGNAF